MADFSLKQNDTWPPLDATLLDGAGAPINLTTATTVKLLMRGKQTSTLISGVCAIVSAAAGTVRYTWVTGNSTIVDVYDAEFEITWSDGKIGSVPNSGYFSVEVVDDLG